MPDIKMDYQNNQLVIQNFMNVLKNSSNIDFVRGMLFCFGAPTIKGIKSAFIMRKIYGLRTQANGLSRIILRTCF